MATTGITADSVPVYGWLFDYWSAADWINWFYALQARDGTQGAVTSFVNAWNDSPPLASNLIWSRTNDNLKAIANQYGFLNRLQSSFVGDILGTADAPIEAVTGAATSAGKAIETFSAVLPWLIVAVVVLVAYLVAKNPKQVFRLLK